MASLRIAMIGLRGVPATWGGVEHHVEQLGLRLTRRGHDVTIFNRSNYLPHQWRQYHGMRVRTLPTLETKHMEAIAHSFLATLETVLRGYDIVHYHALGPGLCAPVARALGRARVVQTVHGLDNHRAKWGGAARRVLDAAEWLSPRVPDETIVVSRDLRQHFRRRHGRSVTWISNGVIPASRLPAAGIRKRYGLDSGYLLYVGRLVPEKAPDLLLRAYRGMSGDTPLVIAGDSSFTDGYVAQLRHAAALDPRVRMVGYVYGTDLAELYSNAAVFVLPSALEGLPLTLLEAASYGTPIVASDIPPHVEVLSPTGPGRRLFAAGSPASLTETLEAALETPASERRAAEDLRSDVLRRYDWNRATDMTESIYLRSLSASIM